MASLEDRYINSLMSRFEAKSREQDKLMALFKSSFSSPVRCPDFDPSHLILPAIPAAEEDPRARVNVMIKIFNASLRPGAKVDRGFFHEISTAIDLIYLGGIVSGRQISRPLTPAETRSGLKGDSQNILAPLNDGRKREIDMLCQIRGKPHIVEAKDTQTTDTHQMKRNVDLAIQIAGGVMYSLPGERIGQENALRAYFARLPEARALPPLQVMHVHERVSDLATTVRGAQVFGEMGPIVTMGETDRRINLEFDYGENISHEDLDFCEREVARLRETVDKSDRAHGWAMRALRAAKPIRKR